MGLEAEVITGWAKGASYYPGFTKGRTNHAWNAFKTKKGWFLVDATWGDTDNGKVVLTFGDLAHNTISTIRDIKKGKATFDKKDSSEYGEYFATKPEKFIKDHYPIDQEWQLLKDTVSKEEFEGVKNKKFFSSTDLYKQF